MWPDARPSCFQDRATILHRDNLPTVAFLQAPPQGDKRCPNDCNGVGVCQADFGYCLCPAGAAPTQPLLLHLFFCTSSYATLNRLDCGRTHAH